MNKTWPLFLACGLLAISLVAGCEPAAETPAVPATAMPTATSVPTATPTAAPTATDAPTATLPPPTAVPPTPTVAHSEPGWDLLRPGLERRRTDIVDEDGQRVERLYVLRVDPALFRLGVAYNPEPQTLEMWQAQTGALIVINGGYFREENGTYFPAGLIVIDGQAMGSSYGTFAGMLAVTRDGAELRWLAQAPYTPQEPLLAALQSFPLLIKPGGELGFPEQYEDYQQARRTAIGQDRAGRILFMVAPQGYFTLHRLSAYLAASDLDLDIAMNLDGGPSSGVMLADPPEKVSTLTTLPVVITVHAR